MSAPADSFCWRPELVNWAVHVLIKVCYQVIVGVCWKNKIGKWVMWKALIMKGRKSDEEKNEKKRSYKKGKTWL